MSRSIFLFTLLITLLITGCGQPITPIPLKTPTLESRGPALTSTPAFALTPILPVVDEEWTIKMTHSGGIMGVLRSIEISSDGKYAVTDDMKKQTIAQKLSAGEVSKLQEIVSKIDYISAEKPIPSACADCFIYDLEIQKDGKRFSIHVDDVTMPKSGMETLITYLRDLIDAALK